MSDLISRQAAIDAVSDCGICLQKIIDLPSAQPKSANELSKTAHFVPNEDFISRKAAIDALAKNMPSLTTPDGCGEFDHDIQVTDEAYVDCMQIIHELPSAQPEIIRCKDCYHYPSEYADCPMIGWARNENDFCSKAERKDEWGENR